MNFKKVLIGCAISLGSASAMAATIDIGGVIFDPEAVNGGGSLEDFQSNGSVFENAVVNPGDVLSGFGMVDRINSVVPNMASFCPGCELTYTFTATLVGFTPTSGDNGEFEFNNVFVEFFVDDSPDFLGDPADAGDGALWLSLSSDLLEGTGQNLGSGSDTGSGTSLLDVVGGLAAAYFNTNGEAGGADMVLNSSFFDLTPDDQTDDLLGGTFDLRGDAQVPVPEPTSMTLLGLGLLGLARASRRRKV